MKELIDNRNITLWNKIDSNFQVYFEKTLNKEYAVYSKGSKLIFYIGTGELCKDSFTHEMLHVYFRLNDCYLGAGLSNILLGNNRLGKILSKELVEHIGNCFEHKKMFPMYIEMGFDRTKFLTDYNQYKCEPSELEYLQVNYKRDLKYTDLFIGKLVAMFCDPNQDFDYIAELKEFKKLDSKLYSIIKSSIELWDTIEIGSKDIMLPDYNDLVFKLDDDLEDWYEGKI